MDEAMRIAEGRFACRGTGWPPNAYYDVGFRVPGWPGWPFVSGETMREYALKCAAILLAASTCAGTALAQDHNYVPGWADTTNHRYKGSKGGEWKAKTELFNTLGGRNAAAKCTLRNLSEADGNVIVNQYRSRERKTNAATALRVAHQQVEAHHRRLKMQGKC